ncbi:MAG: DUF4835 family protein [Flavobacteriaceae bacterium]|nr:DUF4835 family protein [Flavobacteriaceae bacterium]
MKLWFEYMRNCLVILFLLLGLKIQAQELNCLVTINADQIQSSNTQVYNTLQTAISEYLNNTKWTNKNYKPQEKVQCAIIFNILEQPSLNEFRGNVQVQVSRPVFNSTYQSPIFNFKDDDLTFSYTEFQPLIFNENSFDSNLVSILTFYAYTILGIDADTFALNGGQEYHQKAENVVNQAQQGGFSGWNRIDGNTTRYQLNDNILSPAFQGYRTALYEYHLKGLDAMSDNKKDAKNSISNAVLQMRQVYNRRANAFLLRVFMDTKSDEIVDIFSDGPNTNNASLKETLLLIYPSYSPKWEKIKI